MQRKAKRPGASRGDQEAAEIASIEAILAASQPPRGTDTAQLTASKDGSSWWAERKFERLGPLSKKTKVALKKAKFINLTAIQRAAIPHALSGRDVLGAAKTGSGKTLAFLIPVVERLFRLRWGPLDGLGAIIISPTRELAMQIFEELRTIGEQHDLSAGLLIGGKDVQQEASRVGAMNILVVTPGRLLQHMDESPDFNADNVKILVLDEADRILDMGFSATVNAILHNLPKRDRQTLLFSATQTKSVKSLARLSLDAPEYVSAHSEASKPTPVKLEQAYMICNLQDKMDVVWSFIKTHLSSRIIVFFSTCNQVKFVYEAFRRLRPGTPLRCLHGKMSQQKRVVVYGQFCDSKAGVLFATDIAARGLDFPKVDWVLQADCPEDVASYIHRVGRTARYTHSGRGLLLLLPSEQKGMIADLKEAKVELKCLKYNKEKIQPVSQALQALLSKDAEVKTMAQKSIVSYLRSVFLQPKKHVFDVQVLPATEFALSLGLTSVPKLKMLKGGGSVGGEARQNGAARGRVKEGNGGADDAENEARDGTDESPSSSDLEISRGHHGGEDASDDEFLVLKTKHEPWTADTEVADADHVDKPAVLDLSAGKKKKKKKMKIKIDKSTGTKVLFDEEGRAMDPLEALAGDVSDGEGYQEFASIEERAAAAQKRLRERDERDKKELKQLRKAKRQEKRARRLEREHGAGAVAYIGGASVDDDSDGHRRDSSSSDDDGAIDDFAFMGMREENRTNAAARRPPSLEDQEAAALALIRGS